MASEKNAIGQCRDLEHGHLNRDAQCRGMQNKA